MDLRVKVGAREIFLFSLHQFYRTMPGFFSIGCTLIAYGALFAVWGSLDTVMGIALFLAIAASMFSQVIMMRRRAEKQASDPNMSQETYFKFDYNGFKVTRGKEKAQIPWKQIIKVGKIKDIYVLYLTQNRAYLIPGEYLKNGREQKFLRLLKEYMPAERIKISDKKGKTE